MDQETVSMLAHKARHKIDFLNQSKLRYLVSAMFAGIFIGLGDILIFTVGGYLHDVHSPMTKIAVGMAFSVALSLIILLGSELFTSNNMVMAVGAMSKETSIKDGGKVLGYSYLGNFIGAILIALLFIGTGLFKGTTLEYFEYTALGKIDATAYQLFFKGILCNILVCSGVLAAYKLTLHRKYDNIRYMHIIRSYFSNYFRNGIQLILRNFRKYGRWNTILRSRNLLLR